MTIERVLNFMEVGCGGRVCVAGFDSAFVHVGSCSAYVAYLLSEEMELR
jgi:hypothetical protein